MKESEKSSKNESYCAKKEGIAFTITVGVKPNAYKTEFYRDYGGAVMLRVNAPPTKGKANKEIKKYLKSLTGGRARILRGKKSTTKQIRISSLDPEYTEMNPKEFEKSLLER